MKHTKFGFQVCQLVSDFVDNVKHKDDQDNQRADHSSCKTKSHPQVAGAEVQRLNDL